MAVQYLQVGLPYSSYGIDTYRSYRRGGGGRNLHCDGVGSYLPVFALAAGMDTVQGTVHSLRYATVSIPIIRCHRGHTRRRLCEAVYTSLACLLAAAPS